MQSRATSTNQDSIVMYITYKDAFTRESLPVSLTVMDEDSVVLNKYQPLYSQYQKTYFFEVKELRRPSYIFYAEDPEHEPVTTNIIIKKKDREIKELPPVLMHRSAKALKEVTVTASKVMMVHHGDTTIYDASYFKLSHGSMLDALIRSLPGAELDADGRITLNGEFVSSLLVNGRDFFKGDPKIALDNLPAYYVDKIKSYHKMSDQKKWLYGDSAQISKYEDPLVLDVILKREYAKGWIANAEAGRGLHDTYLYRIFGMRYTDHSGLFVFGNFNNINNSQAATGNGGWTNQDAADGIHSHHIYGLNLNIDGKKGNRFNSSLKYEKTKTTTEQAVSNDQFFDSGDVYTRSRENGTSRRHEFRWNGQSDFSRRNARFAFFPNVSYSKFESQGTSLNASFLSFPSENYRGEALDSLFAPVGSPRLTQTVINRRKLLTRGRFHDINLGGEAHTSLRIGTYKAISLNAQGNYMKDKQRLFEKDEVGFGMPADAYDRQYRFVLRPSVESNIRAMLDAANIIERKYLNVSFSYQFEHTYSSGERNLYRLDRLGADYPFGTLPSTNDSLQSSIDIANSYNTTTIHNEHEVSVGLRSILPWMRIDLNLPYVFRHSLIKDYRNLSQQEQSRSSKMIHPQFTLSKSQGKNVWQFNMAYSQREPSMQYLLEVRDDSDPLQIHIGNKHLKDTRRYTTSLGYRRANSAKGHTFATELNHHVYWNAISMSKLYDKTSGITTIQPRNINGNWNVSLAAHYTLPLDSARHWTVATSTKGNYQNSEDFVSANQFESSSRQGVRNLIISETISLKGNFRKLTCTFKGHINWHHTESPSFGFSPINIYEYDYGINIMVPLLWGIDLESDITMFSRHGFNDRTMNSHELLWNGALSYAFGRERQLTLKLSGHDILRQVSNMRSEINSQGRIETWYKVLPSYAMLHLSYRFNKKPKKTNTL